jgi:hypothetical protein
MCIQALILILPLTVLTTFLKMEVQLPDLEVVALSNAPRISHRCNYGVFHLFGVLQGNVGPHLEK